MKTIKIGKTCSPSTILSHTEIEVDELHLSFGGGMGGGSKKLYGVVMELKEGFYTITTIGGRTIEVGKGFVVTKEQVKLVSVTSDITAHRNYHKHCCKSHIETRYYLVRKDENFKIVHDYVSDKAETVYTTKEIVGEVG